MLLSLLGLFSCKAQNVNNLSVEAFAEALAPETRILDVRTAEEFAAGHLRGAVNVETSLRMCTICWAATWPGRKRAGK